MFNGSKGSRRILKRLLPSVVGLVYLMKHPALNTNTTNSSPATLGIISSISPESVGLKACRPSSLLSNYS